MNILSEIMMAEFMFNDVQAVDVNDVVKIAVKATVKEDNDEQTDYYSKSAADATDNRVVCWNACDSVSLGEGRV